MDEHLSPEELVAYLEGQPTTEHGDRIQGHLAACSTCRKELDSMETVSRRLRSGLGRAKQTRELAPEFVERVKEAIRRSSDTDSLSKEEP